MSSKFTFNYEYRDFSTGKIDKIVTLESSSVSLSDLLADFRDFLRGCGFQVEEDIVVDYPEESED
jgi:hypothetical protein